MSLAKELEQARSRIRDLEAMLETISGRSEGSEFRWEAWDLNRDDRTSPVNVLNLPGNGRFVLVLGKDRFGREMRMQVCPGSGPDGTQGVEIRAEHSLRIMYAGGCNTLYVTEQDPRDIPRQD